jgi:hypothetical protein
MTDLLRKVFDTASRLPEDEKDAVSEWSLAELASGKEWEESFVETQDALSVLARRALKECKRG